MWKIMRGDKAACELRAVRAAGRSDSGMSHEGSKRMTRTNCPEE